MVKQGRCIRVAVALAASLVMSTSAPAQSPAGLPLYRVTDLGAYPGFEDMRVVDINDQGDVLGWLETPVPKHLCPFIWQPSTGMHRCEALLPWDSLRLGGLNRDGVAAASRYDRARDPHAFTWSLHQGFQRLPKCAQGARSSAEGINSAGEVVGSCDFHAVVWRPGVGLVDLNPDEKTTSDGYGINERGQIAVRMRHGGGPFLAGVIDRDGRWTAFRCVGNVGHECYAAAYALNDRGQVVGESQYPGDWRSIAFVWTAREGIRDLTAPGPYSGFSSIAVDINDRGEVVGSMQGRLAGDDTWYEGPFRWTADSGAHYLIDLIDPSDPLAGHITFQSYYGVAINRWGDIAAAAHVDGWLYARVLVLTPVRPVRPVR